MSTNQNTQQINVFSKGMNTDTSDAYIPSELYRYAENLRFVTDTGGDSGELRLIEGYKSTFNINAKVLAVNSIRNLIVIICNVLDHAHIELMNTEELVPNAETGQLRYKDAVILDVEGEPWDTTAHYSTVTRWESNDNVKLYIADGIHPLMQVDISWKDTQTPITSFDGLYQTGGGNVFEGFGNITRTSGLLKPAVVQYAYVLYKKNGGRSNLSPSTLPISLYSETDPHRGQMDNPYTDVGLVVEINEHRSSRYDKILVYRITYTHQGQLPDIDLIIDDNLGPTGSYTFTDIGQDPIESGISFAQFVSLDYMEISPQYIESKNDYLFAGNFTYYKRDDVLTAYENWDPTENVECEIIDDSATVLTDNHSGKRSLQRGELYRYGIVLYDKYGNKWPVKHLADIEVPDYGDAGLIPPYTYDNGIITTKSLGISVTVNNLNRDLFPRYEIVRVSRDWKHRRSITQGIVGRAMLYKGYEDVYDSTNTYYPSGLITMGTVAAMEHIERAPGNKAETASNEDSAILLFCSPGISYGDYLKDVLDAYDENLQLDIIGEILSKYDSLDNDTIGRFSKNGWKWSADDLDEGASKIYFSGESGGFLLRHPDYNGSAAISICRVAKGNIIEIYPAQNVISGKSNTWFGAGNVQEINSYDIPYESTKIVDYPEQDGFSDGEELFTYMDNKTHIGSYSFVNWAAGHLEYCVTSHLDEMKAVFKNRHSLYDSNYYPEYNYPLGAGGKCLLIDLSNELSELQTYKPVSTTISIARLVNRHNKNNNNIYGNSDYSVYSSFGNYFKNDGLPHAVFDGDCYILLFYYNALKTFLSGVFNTVPKMSTVYIVPVETTIDMNSDYGMTYKRASDIYDTMYVRYIQDKACEMYGYVLKLNAYMYNTAYSSEPTIKINTSVDIEDLKDNRFDYRIAHSQQKINNERYDSWLLFKSADYLDVDTRYGEITNLRLFKDLMMFWQKNAVGILSVNERTMLQDSTDTNIILGNGDTLQRYDYLSTIYGMKPHQLADAQSDTTLYWWDGYHKDIIMYPGGHNVLPTKKEKTVSGYINSNTEISKPVLAYDVKYNELLACVVGENPLVYSEMIQQYSAVYKTPFEYKANTQDGLVLFNDGEVYKWNESGISLFPLIRYVINNNSTFVKVYDNAILGMGDKFYYEEFYNSQLDTTKRDELPITIKFNTHGLESTLNTSITNREYDLRFAIPRNAEFTGLRQNNWGERMRGRTMVCELSSSSDNEGFSLQYIITKYRISWS